jgi:uridine phosphorylase
MPIAPSELILNPDGSIYHLNLRPENLADTVLTVGDPDRVGLISRHFDSMEFECRKREFVVHTGRVGNKRVTVLSTGMGTDNVEIVMNELDALANINLQTREVNPTIKALNIIRLGTSGALQTHIELDDLVASGTAIGLDTLMCFYNLPQSELEQANTKALQTALNLPFIPYQADASTELLQTIAYDMVIGNTLTCPGFYAPQGRQLRLKTLQEDLVNTYHNFGNDNFRLSNFEMETAGYYSLGRLLGHNMLSLNAIVAHRIHNVFSSQADKTMNTLIEKVLSRLP